ncbi:Heterokaryon incompatibility domain-containing protein [Madurella fahalii]|uniref:Heterokaryon incompatibility domain-containing protein n=1 Tax=Madurella fahalii TaxID=1157608 RepID=A0ABQ0G5Y9_9PEZI
MRLLKYDTADEIRLTADLPSDNTPPYAILSHTWGEEEVLFEDIVEAKGKNKAGHAKIQFCGDQARRDGLQFFWVDTCCIDKPNNTELQEAINSMFRWYRGAARCYVYLADVSTDPSDASNESNWEPTFRASKWFTRGWTLQDLIAPPSVEFFSREGVRLGDRNSLEQLIHYVTRIPLAALRGSPLSDFSVSERMAWIEKRKTTREEDKAYSLLGIFDISMPLIYSEGEKNAFRRLKEEITRRSGGRESRARKEKEKEILRRLYTSPYQNRKDVNPDRVEGTCDWFVSHRLFRDWQESKSSRMLWVSADPGCGKSVLAKHLVDSVLQTVKSRTVCYFFFKDGFEDQTSVTGALCCILHQLFTQKRALLSDAVLDQFDAGGETFTGSFSGL